MGSAQIECSADESAGRRIELLGMPIDNVSVPEALARIDEFVKTRHPHMVVTPNVDHVIKFQKDREFQSIYREASLILADGMPLLWGARFLGMTIKRKISGSDLFPMLCARSVKRGHRLFFLGGRPGASERAADVMRLMHPGIQIVGTYCPPYGFESDDKENGRIVRMIREANPDILFVGLGAPKQEKWIFRHKHDYQVPVSIGIGVTFEFVSGMVKRAPGWMQRAGLEWFWRLKSEPARLWRRYLIEDIPFFWLLVKHRFFSRR